jgi:putative oxidoreductase
MSIFAPANEPWPSRALALLRIVAGVLFLASGTTKLFGFPPPPMPMPPIQPMTQIWIGAMLEMIGGALIVLGLFTRPTAFILSGEMAVAYFQFHQPGGFFPTTNNGVPAVLFCFLFLYLVFAGAGAWSVDEGLRRRRAD